MEKRTIITWLAFIGTLALILFSIWVTNRSDRNEVSSPETTPVSSDADTETAENGSAEGIAVPTPAKDIDQVLVDIQSTMNEDETILDEEASLEAARVREGGMVIDELGKSYDEFN